MKNIFKKASNTLSVGIALLLVLFVSISCGASDQDNINIEKIKQIQKVDSIVRVKLNTIPDSTFTKNVDPKRDEWLKDSLEAAKNHYYGC